MPNWCHNTLTVSGEAAAVAAFIEKVSTIESESGEVQPLTFMAHDPRPAESEDDWYAWNVSHWGTKWDACFSSAFIGIPVDDAAEVNKDNGSWAPVDGGMQIKFDTAWSPPMAWFETMVAAEPALRFVLRYGEPGMGFAAEYRAAEGAITDSTELDIEQALEPSEMWF